MILNLGISPNFGFIDFEHLTFPTTMSVDYVRVYQNPDNINIGCEPDGFPTQAYIEKYVLFLSILCRQSLITFYCLSVSFRRSRFTEAYTNPNLTTWKNDFQQPFPKNSFLGQC